MSDIPKTQLVSVLGVEQAFTSVKVICSDGKTRGIKWCIDPMHCKSELHLDMLCPDRTNKLQTNSRFPLLLEDFPQKRDGVYRDEFQIVSEAVRVYGCKNQDEPTPRPSFIKDYWTAVVYELDLLSYTGKEEKLTIAFACTTGGFDHKVVVKTGNGQVVQQIPQCLHPQCPPNSCTKRTCMYHDIDFSCEACRY
jgi:hypothetical protein